MEQNRDNQPLIIPPPKRLTFTDVIIAEFLYRTNIHTRQYLNSLDNRGKTWRILNYQRLTIPEKKTYPIAADQYLHPATFYRQMEYLSKCCNVIPLANLLEKLNNKEEIPYKTVAITFDSPWLDTYRYGTAILQNFKLPATMFISTNFIGTRDMHWSDKLMFTARLCHQTHKTYDFYSFVKRFLPFAKPIRTGNLQSALNTGQLLVFSLNTSTRKRREEVHDALNEFLMDFEFEIERTYMNWAELKKLQELNVEFASSGADGEPLDELSGEQLKQSIKQAKATASNAGIKLSNLVALPEGLFSRTTREELAKLGVEFCFTANRDISFAQQANLSTVIGRTNIYQFVAPTVASFACRLWNAKGARREF